MSIISIGVSGLTAAQIALSTSSSNTTNAYTAGYTLQVANFSESTSTVMFIGRNVTLYVIAPASPGPPSPASRSAPP